MCGWQRGSHIFFVVDSNRKKYIYLYSGVNKEIYIFLGPVLCLAGSSTCNHFAEWLIPLFWTSDDEPNITEYLSPANEVWDKVMFLHLCVSFCSQGGDFPACITDHMTRGGGLLPGGSASRGLGQTPPPQILQNTVNKRVVRILLECILVSVCVWCTTTWWLFRRLWYLLTCKLAWLEPGNTQLTTDNFLFFTRVLAGFVQRFNY